MAGRRRLLLAVSLVLLLSAVVAGFPAGIWDGSTGSDGAGDAQAGGSNATNAVPINGCETITEPGRYVLTQNVTNDLGTRTSQNCLWINASDVFFDGNGHRIDGIGVTDSTGVYVGSPAAQENVTVRNLTVSDWHKGVWHRGVRGGTVSEVNATNNAIGIGVENTTGTRVLDNDAGENLIGIRVTNADLAALSGNGVAGNYGVGIHDELTAFDVFGRELTVGPSLDPDGDGRYEDVTGDRETNVYDALSLLGIVTADLANASDLGADHREMLDTDGDGDLDYGDVWALSSD